ncbi:MAG: kelch repeat-containing protein [Chloroflexota bacterium]
MATPVYTVGDTQQSVDIQVATLDWLIADLVTSDPKAQIDLVGYSLGGVVATRWAARLSPLSALRDHVHAIVLLESPVGGSPMANAVRDGCSSFTGSFWCFAWNGGLQWFFGDAVMRDLQLANDDRSLAESIVPSLPDAGRSFDVTSIESTADYLVNGLELPLRMYPCQWPWDGTVTVAYGTAKWDDAPVTIHADQQLGSIGKATSPQCISDGINLLFNNHSEPLSNDQAVIWVDDALKALGDAWQNRHAVTAQYTTPSAGATINGVVQLSAQITSRLPIDHVNMTALYNGEWHVVHQFTGSPYTFDWDVSSLPDQQIQLGLDVADQSGAIRYSPNGVLTVKKGTPCVIPTLPTANTWASVTPCNTSPQARAGHATAWDGEHQQLFVFGGNNTNELWRYDRTTNLWEQQLPSTPAPVRLSSAKAVWDAANHRILVFGLNSAPAGWQLWSFTPSTRRWDQLTPSGSAPAQALAGAVWDRGSARMLVYLGKGLTDDVRAYDPTQNAWSVLTAGGTIPSQRSNVSLAWSEDDQLLFVFGGVYNPGGLNNNTYYNELWAFSPSAGAWTEVASTGTVPDGREGQSAVWDRAGRQMLLVDGGTYGYQNYCYQCWAYKDEVWSYSFVARGWTKLSAGGTHPASRINFAAVWDESSRTLRLFGGQGWPNNTPSGSNVTLSDLWVYAAGAAQAAPVSSAPSLPSPNAWGQSVSPGTVPAGRSGHATAWDDEHQQLFVFGGVSNQLWRYDRTTNLWEQQLPSTPAPVRLSSAKAVWDATNHRMLVFGSNSAPAGWQLWSYTPATRRWDQLTPSGSAPAQALMGAVWDRGGARLLVYLGKGLTDDVRAYDPTQNAWIALTAGGTIPSQRSNVSLAWSEDDQLLFVFGGVYNPGGLNNNTYYNELWAFSPSAGVWTKLTSTGTVPDGREGQSAVWDRTGHQMLVIDGGTYGYQNYCYQCWAYKDEVWSYSFAARAWSRLSAGGSHPAPRTSFAAVWDESSRTVRLFGGQGWQNNTPSANNVSLGDSWIYRATNFTAMADIEAQSAHAGSFIRGQGGSYTLTVKNNGSAIAVGPLQVRDTLPAGLTYVNATGEGWACSHTGQEISCSRAGDLAAGASVSIAMNVAVDGGAAASLTNTVQASSQTADPNWGNNSISDSTATVAPLFISTLSPLPDGTVGVTYSKSLQATGGIAPYSWTVSTGTLPTGLTLNGTTGAISGTPTVAATATFTIRVADANAQTTSPVTRDYTLVIADTPKNLTVTRNGTGSGTVTSSPTGIDCGATCTFSFASGTQVTLTATPASGSVFSGWSGACTNLTGTCIVTMDVAKTVTATFDVAPPSTFLLTLVKNGTGSGTVTSNPAGISCGTDCSESYTASTQVTLAASPAAGSTFTSWAGCDSSNGTSCTVTMSAAKSVTATFTANPILTVTRAGSGTGTVTSTPAGIACGATCSMTLAPGTSVTLTAAPAAGTSFAGWTGCDTSSGTSCTVTMTAAKTVTATFAQVNAGVTVTRLPGVQPSGPTLLATVTARPGCGTISSIQFGAQGRSFDNARVAVTTPTGGPTGQTTGFTFTPPAGTTSVSFTIQRLVPSGGATVNPVVLHDGCGDWRTFVGGGPDAFR